MEPPPPDRSQYLLRPTRKQDTTINVVTLNCRTLRSAAQKNQLARTLNDLNASFGCLQETRITSDDMQFEDSVPPPNFTSNHHPRGYKLYASSADDGNAGCAVAVRSDLDGLVHSWRAVSSRLVYVHIKEAAQPTWILSAYAPHNDRSEEEKDAYYEQLDTVLRSIPRSHLVLIGTDANAQFGASECSPSLGRWYFPAVETSDNGTRILSLAEEHDLMLASTLKRNRLRERVTHDNVERISRELKRRLRADHHVSQLDYILIRTKWATDVVKGGSIPNTPFDSDHRPVRVQIRLRYKPPKQCWQKRTLIRQRYQSEVLIQLEPTERRRAIAAPTLSDITKAMVAARNSTVPEVRPQKKKALLSAQAEHLAAQLAVAKRNKAEDVKRLRNCSEIG
ncbi:reverse transcriptase [Aphelenchoides avenae]|nr:reverse transcriptase [Aphelenchus avenae]